MRVVSGLIMSLGLACGLTFSWTDQAIAAPGEETGATTEHTCSFGMVKGEKKQSCQLPFPPGCKVVNMPGGTKPWVVISKGGLTTCKIDEKQTDWKNKITGTCDRCKSIQCTGRFSAMFDCS